MKVTHQIGIVHVIYMYNMLHLKTIYKDDNTYFQ